MIKSALTDNSNAMQSTNDQILIAWSTRDQVSFIVEQPLHHKSHILVIITCNNDITIDNIESHIIIFPMLLVPYQALCKLMERHGKNWQHLFLIYLHLHIILNRQHFPTFCTFSSSTCYTLYSIGNTCLSTCCTCPASPCCTLYTSCSSTWLTTCNSRQH